MHVLYDTLMIFIKVLGKFGGLTAKQDVGSNEKFTFSAAFLTRVMDIYISQSEMNQNLLFVLGNSTGRIKFNFSTAEARRLKQARRHTKAVSREHIYKLSQYSWATWATSETTQLTK